MNTLSAMADAQMRAAGLDAEEELALLRGTTATSRVDVFVPQPERLPDPQPPEPGGSRSHATNRPTVQDTRSP